MKINGIGCSLVDNLYSPVDFKSTAYKKWSADNGTKDGLITGGLIFGDDLEVSSGVPYSTILDELTGGILTPQKNIGGPGIVALIHMAQLLDADEHKIGFYGSKADDENGSFISEKLKHFEIDTTGYITTEGITPFTDVLSDPVCNDNNGERTFINYIGAAGYLKEENLPQTFFDADMLIFGGTALTPGVHDDLSILLNKAKTKKSITCVNTVYDFRNQKKNPAAPWPLVEHDDDYNLIDLLIMDNEEAVRISGMNDKFQAAEYFSDKGIRAGIITHGSEDILFFSNGHLFIEKGMFTLPVSAEAGRAMRKAAADEADTTGCGDNFAGGVYTSLVMQGPDPSLRQAVMFGIASGGFAGLHRGGVFYEKYKGEKLERLKPILSAYEQQIKTIKDVEK